MIHCNTYTDHNGCINDLFSHILTFLFFCGQVTDDYTVIGRNLFKKETNLQLFVGLKVTLSSGESGVIEGGFGQSGKVKIRIPGRSCQFLFFFSFFFLNFKSNKNDTLSRRQNER